MTINFTSKQQEDLLQCFGKPFVDALPARLRGYADAWGLTGFSLIEYYSVNCLFFCHSTKYGECVLKIFGCEYEWYIGEIQMLGEVNGEHGYVRAYECDEENGAILLQRIFPGTVLKLEPSLEKRISLFADIWQKSCVQPREPALYKTYLKIAEETAKKLIDRRGDTQLQRLARLMVAECEALYANYPVRALLHADLHGDNLLKGAGGEYIIVDPHAKIGPPICDLGRYIANEYSDAAQENRAAVTGAVISRLAAALRLPEVDVACAFFVDITLMTCWDEEDGPFDISGALFAEAYLKELKAQ